MGDVAETLHKCLCYYPLHKLCFFIAVAHVVWCYGHFKFPQSYNGKSESRLYFYLTLSILTNALQ